MLTKSHVPVLALVALLGLCHVAPARGADNDPILNIDGIIRKLIEASKSKTPTEMGKEVDLIQRAAWDQLVKDGFVGVKDSNFLGEKVAGGKFARVYQTPDGMYEFWLEVRDKQSGRNIDVIEWKLDRENGRVVKATGWGDDAHSRGPLDSEVKPNNTSHFDRKKEVLENWQRQVKAKGIACDVKFSKTDQFFYVRRIADLEALLKLERDGVEIPDGDKRKLALNSPMVRLLKGVGLSMGLLVSFDVLDAQMALYRSPFFEAIRGHLERGEFDHAISVVNRARGITWTLDDDILGIEVFKALEKIMSEEGSFSRGLLRKVWEMLLNKLEALIREAQKAAQTSMSGRREDVLAVHAAGLDGLGVERGPDEEVDIYVMNDRTFACPLSSDPCRPYLFNVDSGLCSLTTASGCRPSAALLPARLGPSLIEEPRSGCDDNGGYPAPDGSCCHAHMTYGSGACKDVVVPPTDPVAGSGNPIGLGCDGRGGSLASDGITCCHAYTTYASGPCQNWGTLRLPSKPGVVLGGAGRCGGVGEVLASDGATCCRSLSTYTSGPCKNIAGGGPWPILPQPSVAGGVRSCTGPGEVLAADGATCCRPLTTYISGACKNTAKGSSGGFLSLPTGSTSGAGSGGTGCRGLGEFLSYDGATCCKPFTSYFAGPCRNMAGRSPFSRPVSGGGRCSGIGEYLASDSATCCKPLTTYLSGPCKNVAGGGSPSVPVCDGGDRPVFNEFEGGWLCPYGLLNPPSGAGGGGGGAGGGGGPPRPMPSAINPTPACSSTILARGAATMDYLSHAPLWVAPASNPPMALPMIDSQGNLTQNCPQGFCYLVTPDICTSRAGVPMLTARLTASTNLPLQRCASTEVFAGPRGAFRTAPAAPDSMMMIRGRPSHCPAPFCTRVGVSDFCVLDLEAAGRFSALHPKVKLTP